MSLQTKKYQKIQKQNNMTQTPSISGIKADRYPLIMGIVNTAPDSFSDGKDEENPLDKALRLLDEGANIIDLGGESTRPGAVEIPPEIEIGRIKGVLQDLKKLRPDCFVSIDTRKSVCAKIFLDNGADMINDVSSFEYSPDMADIVAEYDAMLVIMHSLNKGDSAYKCVYDDTVKDVLDFLRQKKDHAVEHGVAANKIIIDPGLGFSKAAEDNFNLLRNIKNFSAIGPVLIGHSRKRFIKGFINSEDMTEIDEATALISAVCAISGAAILRVHDVRRTVRALELANKIWRS